MISIMLPIFTKDSNTFELSQTFKLRKKNIMDKKINYIKELYESGENIISHFRGKDDKNDTDIIRLSYEMQAGNYIKKAVENPCYEEERGTVYSEIINNLNPFKSILEVGVGECTTIQQISKRIPKKIDKYGFDFSVSRVLYGSKHLEKNNIKVNLFVGDMFNAPLLDNSVDIVYTNHTLEPNGGNEKIILKELYRITNRYLVLFEPIYELSTNETKKYMDNHGYIKNLYKYLEELNYNIIDYKILFKNNKLSLNSTGVIIVEKNKAVEDTPQNIKETPFACPVSKKRLNFIVGEYYSSDIFSVYPSICDIPILLEENAINVARFTEFYEMFNT